VLSFLGSTLALSACDGTLTVPRNEMTWGFVQTNALSAGGGAYTTSPTGQFFRGALNSIPDARVKPDTCISLPNTTQGPLNVTYLDAGPSITTQFGTRIDTIPRVSTPSRTTYEVSTPKSFRPGDSVIVKIPGAAGGFPASEIHAKTAEVLTIDSLTIKPQPAASQLRWSQSTDPNSSLLVEFRYSSSGGTSFNQLIRCAFTDDGVDSVANSVLQPWIAANTASRNVTYTRLRTQINGIVGGFLEVISTFQVPTPTTP
jgi:hypothetical protein